MAAEAAQVRAAGASDTKDPEPVETMDLEITATPRREQRRLLDEASEALALKRAATCQGLPDSEPRPVRRFRKPGS